MQNARFTPQILDPLKYWHAEILASDLASVQGLAMDSPIIEDNFEDVLGKAMRGLGLSANQVAARAELPLASVECLLAGRFEVASARRLARVLDLNGDCLVELAENAVRPSVELPAGIMLHNTPFPVPGYEEMTVNSYSVVPSAQSGEGCLVDAGASFDSILEERAGEVVASNWQFFLTHTHGDHVTNYDALTGKAAQVYAPAEEPYQQAKPVHDGDVFEIGPWKLTAIETPGHSPGGMSYLLQGASMPVVFVGDALFCYSIGKVAADFPRALALIREKLLSLPAETIVCPGHGPLTSVGFERRHNPFFA